MKGKEREKNPFLPHFLFSFLLFNVGTQGFKRICPVFKQLSNCWWLVAFLAAFANFDFNSHFYDIFLKKKKVFFQTKNFERLNSFGLAPNNSKLVGTKFLKIPPRHWLAAIAVEAAKRKQKCLVCYNKRRKYIRVHTPGLVVARRDKPQGVVRGSPMIRPTARPQRHHHFSLSLSRFLSFFFFFFRWCL